MPWTWSPGKNRENQRKHGLSFETAQLVFADPYALSRPDPFQDEERWQTVGVIGQTAIFVVHTWPESRDASAASSARERRLPMKERPTKKASSSRLTSKQRAELEALAALPDDRIDTSDIPEVRDWSGAKRGLFYRPVKKQLTLRVDADVIAWFKSRAPKGRGYQTQMNVALRDYVRRQARLRKAG